MVRKSYGKMHKSRKKLSGRKIGGLTHYLREFSVGDKVHVIFMPSSSLPHPRLDGKTGTILGKRGNSYEVMVKDHDAEKTLFLRPEHIKPQKNKGK